MAFIDYGAIAFKNGKLISTEMFTPMVDMVGWEDTDNDIYEYRSHGVNENIESYTEPLRLKGNYFAYIGDKDCTLAFYKEQVVIAEREEENRFRLAHEYFNCTNYTWSKWKESVYDGQTREFSKIQVTKRNGYYICKWLYKGDFYKVYFGCGVDLPTYKKWRVVNLYRTPAHIWLHIKRKFKDVITK